MSFVIDGSEWCFDGWSAEEIDHRLGGLVDRIDVARSRGERVWIGDDLQTRHVMGDLSVWDLWSPDSPVELPRELRQELAATLGRAHLYLDESSWPEGIIDCTEIAVGCELVWENPDVAWAHHHTRAGRAVACLGLRRRGIHPTRSAAGVVDVHWVVDESGHRGFFRAAILVERDTEETLERLAPHAFPDLFFLEGVWRGLADFEGGYTSVRNELRRHLALYDDMGAWAFTAPPPLESMSDTRSTTEGGPDQRLVERRFSLASADVAPENPNVSRDATCRSARERVLKGRTLYCHWHGKISPHINRIHIHPPIPESEGKLIVAIFHAHLPLLGDA